ncbi:hypothetical protein TOK_0175 [Pseudonocardia sp. N23]|nr:hypothetical protein TOK_0175 [Pseudonocardia sp. N23]
MFQTRRTRKTIEAGAPHGDSQCRWCGRRSWKRTGVCAQPSCVNAAFFAEHGEG